MTKEKKRIWIEIDQDLHKELMERIPRSTRVSTVLSGLIRDFIRHEEPILKEEKNEE